MKNELEQKIADTIIRLHYCRTHWYYPWCTWWLLKAKYVNPLKRWVVSKILGEEALQNHIEKQIKSMQWSLRK